MKTQEKIQILRLKYFKLGQEISEAKTDLEKLENERLFVGNYILELEQNEDRKTT